MKLILCLDSKNCVSFPSRENQQSAHECSFSRWPMKINESEQQRRCSSGLPTVTYTANFLSCVSWADSLSWFQCSSDGEHGHSSRPSQTEIAGWKGILACWTWCCALMGLRGLSSLKGTQKHKRKWNLACGIVPHSCQRKDVFCSACRYYSICNVFSLSISSVCGVWNWSSVRIFSFL